MHLTNSLIFLEFTKSIERWKLEMDFHIASFWSINHCYVYMTTNTHVKLVNT